MGQKGTRFSQGLLEVRLVRLRKKILAIGGPEVSIKNQRQLGYLLCQPQPRMTPHNRSMAF